MDLISLILQVMKFHKIKYLQKFKFYISSNSKTFRFVKLKDLMPITFSSPKASTRSSTFFIYIYQMKAHIFLFANPKFQLQILCSFGDNNKNCEVNWYTRKYFLCIFIIVSSPGVHTFFLPLESKQEATLGWNFKKCISEVKINQYKVKNMHVKMGISTFKYLQKWQ